VLAAGHFLPADDNSVLWDPPVTRSTRAAVDTDVEVFAVVIGGAIPALLASAGSSRAPPSRLPL